MRVERAKRSKKGARGSMERNETIRYVLGTQCDNPSYLMIRTILIGAEVLQEIGESECHVLPLFFRRTPIVRLPTRSRR